MHLIWEMQPSTLFLTKVLDQDLWGWVMKYKLGDICEIVSGSTPKTNVPEFWDGNIKWITPAEINVDSYIITDSERKITELGVKKTGLTPFPRGTVILSSRAPIGKVAIAGCEMYCNQGFKNLICSETIYNKYLYWFLKGNTEFLNSLGRGATFMEISKSIVSTIEINLPSMECQREAVRILEKTNNIINYRKKQLQALDDLIKAQFVEMFGDPISSKKKKIKLSDMGKVFTGNTPSMKIAEYYDSNDIPFVKPSDIGENGVTIIQNVEFFISENARNVARIMPSGSVLVTCIGTIGKIGIATKECCCNQQINYIIPYENNNSVYIAYCLSFYKKILSEMANAPVVPIINKSQFSAIEIPTVPNDMQEKFSKFVAKVDKSKSVVQKAMDEAQMLLDSLMKRYFG